MTVRAKISHSAYTPIETLKSPYIAIGADASPEDHWAHSRDRTPIPADPPPAKGPPSPTAPQTLRRTLLEQMAHNGQQN